MTGMLGDSLCCNVYIITGSIKQSQLMLEPKYVHVSYLDVML